MKINIEIVYKLIISLFLFFTTIISSIEFTFVSFLVIFLAFLFKPICKFPKTLVDTILPLVIILLISVTTSIFYLKEAYDFFRDFLYLIKPIMLIFFGYFLVEKITNKNFLFILIIYLSLLFAIIHLYKVLLFLLDNEFNTNSLRKYCGKDNFIEMFGLMLIIFNKRTQKMNLKIKYLKITGIIILISFIFYFSRTLFVSIFILYLGALGFLKITRRGIKYITIFAVTVLVIYSYLSSIEIDRNKPGLSSFLYKIKMAPSEIFLPDRNFDIRNHNNLWDHWRAYEASKAFEELNNTPYKLGFVFGKGLGSLVDLGFIAPLNKSGLRHISHLHNGYVYIILKAGFLGLIFYFSFILHLYLQSYKSFKNERVSNYNNLLSGLAVYYLFTTLIITGIYNSSETVAMILGGIVSLKNYSLN